MISPPTFHLRLFYSYSHKDHQHRDRMERALTLLREQDGVLKDWSDLQILAGQSISREVQRHMDAADIFAFLLSPNFIASEACRREWLRVTELTRSRPSIVSVPIILTRCDWKQLNGMGDLKALPDDGKPITEFSNRDIGWQQVCEGLRTLISGLRTNFSVRKSFRDEINETDFISQEHVPLQKIFVFPQLCSYTETKGDADIKEDITNAPQLIDSERVLVHGDELSGKSALCRYLFLYLADAGRPVLHINLAKVRGRVTEKVFSDTYKQQYHGDYSLWRKEIHKTVVIDNLSSAAHAMDFLDLASKEFERVVVTTSSQTYYAYFRDDQRLSRYRIVEIMPLTHGKQEQLIRQRLALSSRPDMQITDGHIDQVENHVNAIVIRNRIVPRYPFYVLSILQTYEAFMPTNLSITSHGHCYHVLIVAHLFKAGIANSDDEIDSCFNFSEHLAFEIHESDAEGRSLSVGAFDAFLAKYKDTYVLNDSTLNRLCDGEYGIVVRDRGSFRTPYMYYFFLGRFLAKRSQEHRVTLERMLEQSHVAANCLALIFVVHHTNDGQLIDDIVLRNMCTLDDLAPATLDREEARLFEDVVAAIPKEVRSDNSVLEERGRDRRQRDVDEELEPAGADESVGVVNDVYRILKNNEILGQVLRNKYGSLKRNAIVDIIEAIADGGLRVVRLLVGSQEELNDVAAAVHKKKPAFDLERIKRTIRVISFLWTMNNVESVVAALNKPEIRDLVQEVVERKGTAAYHLIGYFLRLDTAEELTVEDHKHLKEMLGKYRYPFIRSVLSLRTQWYLNTHKVRVPVEQAICAELGVTYRPRLKPKS